MKNAKPLWEEPRSVYMFFDCDRDEFIESGKQFYVRSFKAKAALTTKLDCLAEYCSIRLFQENEKDLGLLAGRSFVCKLGTTNWFGDSYETEVPLSFKHSYQVYHSNVSIRYTMTAPNGNPLNGTLHVDLGNGDVDSYCFRFRS